MISDFNAATFNVTHLKLFEVLSRFDTRKLNKRMEEKPELYFSLINAFCNFSRLQLAREKFQWQKKQAKARQHVREQKQRARTPILITASTLRSVRTAMQATPLSVHTPRPQETTTTGTALDLKSLRAKVGRAAFLELGTGPRLPIQRFNGSTVQRFNSAAIARSTSQFEDTTVIQDPGSRVQQLT